MLNLKIHLNFQSVVGLARETAVFFVIVSEQPSRFINNLEKIGGH